MASRPGPEAVKQPQTITLPPRLTQMLTGHTPSKKFNFCLISPQNICPKVLGIIKIFFAKCETSLSVLLVSSGFCLGTLPWMPFLPCLFLIVESWTLTFIEASEACSSLEVSAALHRYVFYICLRFDLNENSVSVKMRLTQKSLRCLRPVDILQNGLRWTRGD